MISSAELGNVSDPLQSVALDFIFSGVAYVGSKGFGSLVEKYDFKVTIAKIQLKHARDNNISKKLYQGDLITGNLEESIRDFTNLRDEYHYIKKVWEVYNRAIMSPSKVITNEELSNEQIGPTKEDGTFN